MATVITRLLPIGADVKYGDSVWRIGAIAWLGERIYFLVRGPRETAMVPAVMLEPDNEGLLLDIKRED